MSAIDDFLRLFDIGAQAYDAYQGTEDTVTRPYFMPGQEEGYTTAIGAALGDFAQGPDQYYPGQTVADLDPNTIAGQNDQLASLDRVQQLADAGGSAALSLAQGGAGLVGGFDLPDQVGFGIPQEYQDAIMNPIMRNLEDRVMPALHTQATQQGAFGGSRMAQQKADAAQAATEAATDAMIRGNLDARQQTIGQRAGDISATLTGRGQDINQYANMNEAMRAGLSGTGTAIAGQLMPGRIQTQIGDERTAYEQSLIDADRERFDWNRAEGNDYIDRLFDRMSLSPDRGTIQQGQSGGLLDAYFAARNAANTGNIMYGNTPPPGQPINTNQPSVGSNP